MRRSPEIKKQNVRLNQLELELAIRKKLLESKYPQLHLNDWVNSDVEPSQRFEIVATMFDARPEATQLRGGELRLEREEANLDESSRVLITLLNDAFTKTSTNFQLMHTSLRRWQAAATEVDVRTAQFKNGRTPVNVLLQSSQQQADASADYYQAFAEYRKSCSHIDYLSGTLLASKNINISEVTRRISSSKE